MGRDDTHGVERNPFRNERVVATHFHPNGWSVPPIDEQITRLRGVFPGISLSKANNVQGSTPPAAADGICLLPTLRYLGKFFRVADPYNSEYWQLISKVLELMAKTRDLCNFQASRLHRRFVRLSEHSRLLLEQLEDANGGDVLALPVTLGDVYAGHSVRSVRWEASHSKMLPLGSVQIGCLLLVMPDRLATDEDLYIDCPADEYDFNDECKWLRYTYFSFWSDRIEFDAGRIDNADTRYGSAVAFL